MPRYQAELGKLNRDVEKMIQAICNGFANEALKIKFNAADVRIKELKSLIENADVAPPPLHPGMAGRYRQEVSRLVEALNDPDHRTEAASPIRDLVDRIVLTPHSERTDLMIGLHGDLTGILAMAHGKTPRAGAKGAKRLKRLNDTSLSAITAWSKSKMVAGAGFEPAAFRL